LKKFILVIYIILVLAPLLAFFLYHSNSGHDFYWYLRISYTICGIGLLIESFAFRKKLNIPNFLIPFILYAIYQLLWSMINGSIEKRGVFYFINNEHLQTIFMLIISYNVIITKKMKDYLTYMFLITVILTLFVSIVQFFNPMFFSFSANENIWDIYQIRRGSIFTIIAPLDLGLSFLPIIALLIAEYLAENKRGSIFLMLIGGLVSVLSNTRWVMGGYILILTMVVFHYRSRFFGRARNLIVTMLSIACILFFITYLGYDLGQFWNERLLSEGSLTQTTRFFAITNFLRFFPEKPWFGTGVHLTEEIYAASHAFGSSQIHVGYLSHLVSFGIIGSIFLFGFWLWLAITLWKNAKKTDHWGSFYAFLIFLWGEATWVHFSLMHYGLIFAFIFDNYYISNSRILEKSARTNTL